MYTFLRILLLAIVYWVVGRIALLMAIPPGFAGAAFPPVGIALGMLLLFGVRHWPGVFFGSLGLNLSVAYGISGQLSAAGLGVAIGIAVGSTLAVVCGERLIARFCSRGQALSSERNIALSYFLGGPLSCCVSATMASVCLFISGTTARQDVPYTWWTWWLGDSIGVLVALPIMYMLFATPRALWRARLLSVGAPLAIACALMIAIFIRVNDAELDKIRQSFLQQALPFSTNIKARLESQLSVLKSIDSLFHASNYISAKDFDHFVANPLSDNPEIYALSWNEYVRHKDRPRAERELSLRDLSAQTITEVDPQGNLIVARQRLDYVYVKYVVPLAGNEKAQSFNVASIPNRREVLERSVSNRSAQMTAPIKLVQDNLTQKAMLLFYPVYQHLAPHKKNDWSQIQGFATAVVFMDRIVDKALAGYGKSPTISATLEYLEGGTAEVLHAGKNRSESVLADYLFRQDTFEFAGQTFRVTLSPTDAFIAQHRSPLNWAVLALGFLFCALLGGFLLSLSTRASMIRQQVFDRTLELSLILEHASEAILTINCNGRITKINTAAARLMGSDPKYLENTSITPYLPKLSLEDTAIDENFLDSASGTIETSLRTASDEYLAVEVGSSTIELEGEWYRILILHDLTERKKAERLKSEFISTVSHELRTPLTSINGALKLVSTGVVGEIDDKVKNMVDIARNNTERLEQLVNDILDVEKLDFDQIKFDFQSLILVDVVNQAVEGIANYAEGFRVSVVKREEFNVFDTITVTADKNRLIQVLINLLSNAIKYSEPGGRVDIGLSVSENEITLSIKDEGRGMPEYFKKYIFQRFSQADSTDSREKSGTGLGLYITKTLVDKMSGSIHYESELGRGTEFFVTLPRTQR
ncbi:CHASE domain-containing protein [Gilvimarinus japonicus]|uniref:histidine kinase n=1 Tax=Gilvimarinus japonicus TaxID=1796469 RepID=A0ABV7HND5_9GAMM